MIVPYLFGGATLLLVAFIVWMLVTPDTIEDEVDRELTRIRRQIYRGWSDERIAGHHPDFCVCEIHHLRTGLGAIPHRRAASSS